MVHHVNQALRANVLYQRDKDYIVRDGEVMLIDEFTGRMMHGRRLSEGLHQAIEAKEGADIQPENQTLASVTIQNYFRLYDKLSGMTGTAATEAQEFLDIYKMDVAEIPTNRPVMRQDDDDEVYRTAAEKNARDHHPDRGLPPARPADPGRHGLHREVRTALRAAQGRTAGRRTARPSSACRTACSTPAITSRKPASSPTPACPGTVTIATNMAGRGTDIQLGGNVDMRLAKWRAEQRRPRRSSPRRRTSARSASRSRPRSRASEAQALAAGGLFVLGTERHESRRIDNQLRGRTGRQGDPGRSKFFLSCEDDLLRIFAGDRLDAIMRTFGVEEGEAITHKWLNSAIATAQKRVEQRNYEIRKNLLKYDDVVNDQRKAVFEQRREFMEIDGPLADRHRDAPRHHRRPRRPPPAAQGLCRPVGRRRPGRAGARRLLGLDLPIADWAAEEGIADEEIQRAPQRRRRRARRRARGADLARADAPAGEELPAADGRHAVARAPDAPRPPAQRHRPARLWPARSARTSTRPRPSPCSRR